MNTSGKIICKATLVEYECKTNITCNSSNLIYCLTCTKCKLQYVGQTKGTIQKRFQGHFYNIKKADPKGKPLDPKGLHFLKPNHAVNDVEIGILAFITITPLSKESLKLRLKVEKKWILLMRCPAPTGLNIFDIFN